MAVNVLWIKHSELKIGPSGVFIGNFEPARSIIQHINLRILFIKEEKKKEFFWIAKSIIFKSEKFFFLQIFGSSL